MTFDSNLNRLINSGERNLLSRRSIYRHSPNRLECVAHFLSPAFRDRAKLRASDKSSMAEVSLPATI